MLYSTALNSIYYIQIHELRFEAFFASKNQNKQKFDIEFMFDGNLKLLKLQQESRILICNSKSGQVRHYSFNISTQEDQPVKNISINLETD